MVQNRFTKTLKRFVKLNSPFFKLSFSFSSFKLLKDYEKALYAFYDIYYFLSYAYFKAMLNYPCLILIEILSIFYSIYKINIVSLLFLLILFGLYQGGLFLYVIYLPIKYLFTRNQLVFYSQLIIKTSQVPLSSLTRAKAARPTSSPALTWTKSPGAVPCSVTRTRATWTKSTST